MFIAFLILGLVLLIGGGVGLFYTNINLAAGSHIWVIGNITFSTLTVVGIGVLIFMGLFNREFE
jgi:hypothetical protein